ncbi:cytochrome c biogenesis heme-transporting ATPase CcmA [Paraburkholderia sp.]|uniref:cytochrome c biogenesis heme-transporting ATPase CcmA n=1 Tax=Paraburkholderia sp. TaxID=1926495 RepID=UPI002D40CBEB|nr:cytochrome c biogenesis heme-transporting ATPase CcmA [Paraburkholderia sp.]HZZ04536.1 cytochrome c biogenesis heme-transporting ATPase CcmA [Paraburkholderia sp.]
MLCVDHLGLGRRGREIVDGVGFNIEAGWALQIHGSNGCGKTTLLRALAGMLPPAAGSVRWRGMNVHAQPERFRRERAYVGHSNGLSDDLSVLENLRFAALLGVNPGSSRDARMHERDVLETAGLWTLRHARVGSLSQGQRRRVALARVMLERKPLWLLDEPAEALDDAAQAWLADALDEHLQDGGIVVATTHLRLPTAVARTQHLQLQLQLERGGS